MAFRSKFSEQAAKDVSDIITYIRKTLSNPQAAERFYQAVEKRRGKIQKHPYIYPLSRDERLRAEGYRTAVIGNYLMFYLVDDDNEIVYISRVIYGKQNLAEIIMDEGSTPAFS